MLSNPTMVVNNTPIVLPAIGAVSPALNPLYTACDALNGNYFMTTGRDLATFYCAPAASAPTWSGSITYLSGMVVKYLGQAYIAIQGGVGQTPSSSPASAYWALYADGESTITLYSAPDTCTGRKADIDDYVVPLATELYPGVEFLVLPSSVFTQANQQFQFLASSNLISAYIRNF